MDFAQTAKTYHFLRSLFTAFLSAEEKMT